MKKLIFIVLFLLTANVASAQIPCDQTLPANATADDYFQRGKVCIGAYKFGQSISDFTTAISLDPNQPQYYAYRGYVKGVPLHTVAEEEIFADFDAALAVDEDYYFTYFARGRVNDKYSYYLQAVEDYDRAIELNPDFGDAYVERAMTHLSLGDIDEALSGLDDYQGADANILTQIADLRERYDDGEAAWSSSDIDGCGATTVFSYVLMRSEATRSSKAVNLLSKMKTVVGIYDAVDAADGYRWYEVRYAGTNGFIRSDLLHLDDTEACAGFE